MANSKDSGNNIFRDWIFPSLGILIGIAAVGFGQSIFYGLVFLMMIIIAIIFGHKCGFRILRYTNKLKYISQVTKHTFNKVEKKNCLSNQYDQEINNLRTILPTYLPESLFDVSNGNSKEIELCRTSIACSDGYNKVHNLEKISMVFPIFSRLNYNRQWLMPVFGTQDLKQYCDEFTELSLKYWNKFAVDNNTGKLNNAMYLFITWDLINIEKWDPSRDTQDKWIKAISSLLMLVLKKTQSKQLIVDRVLILPNDVLSDQNKKNILKNIMNKYFLDSNNKIPKYYRISYICQKDLDQLTVNQVEFFKDVCLFSEKTKTIDNLQTFPAFDRPEDYFYIQFSHNVNLETKNFLYLFALERDKEETKQFYDKFLEVIIDICKKVKVNLNEFNKEIVI